MHQNLKNFFELTEEKIKIFVLIFFLTIFLRGIVNEFKLKFLEVIEKILSPHYLLYKYTIPSFPSGVNYDIVIHPSILLLVFIVGLIYWYFLSCLIVFIHKRLWFTSK